MTTIAIVDDDIYIGDMLEQVLKKEGYGVLRAYSGTEALLLLQQCRPELVLLDLMLPGLSGEEVLPALTGIPVIILSAKADVEDRVGVLLSGAADYLTKPFEVKELLARIVVQLRAKGQEVPGVLASGQSALALQELRLLPDTREVWVEETCVHLTRTEYAILHLLMQNIGQVVTKNVMLEEISRDTPDCMESSLKVHVSNLRRKLREVNGKDYIEAVWGIGFTLRV